MDTATAATRSARPGPEVSENTVKTQAQRIAFVSGGMGGIGTAICRRLARSGVKVVAGCLPGYEKKAAWLANMSAEGLPVQAAETPPRPVFPHAALPSIVGHRRLQGFC